VELTAAFACKCTYVQSPTRQAVHNVNAGFEETGRVADLT
jgi:hypothetical protein